MKKSANSPLRHQYLIAGISAGFIFLIAVFAGAGVAANAVAAVAVLFFIVMIAVVLMLSADKKRTGCPN